ncbi:MAG: Mor transcription activator family protein [bacterium]
MKEKPWLDEIKEDEMPNEELKTVASLCGVKTAIDLMKNLPGTMIFIPNKALIKLRNKYICKKYDGTKKSLLILCKELSLAERQLYQIIKNNEK